jgi:adenylate cyclase
VFFNDPVPQPDAPERAVRMALQMQSEVTRLATGWRKRGYELQLGIGIATGFATIGGIGFPGRIDYGAIGTVTNLAARLCAEAAGGEILLAPRVVAALSEVFAIEPAGEYTLKGFARPLAASRVRAAA